MLNIKRNILLNPGPATTTDSVKLAMIVPDICPREQEFVNVIDEIRAGLLEIVKADADDTCILLTGSGTAAMDATINSVVPPGKKVFIINNGVYGERMVQIARAYNIEHLDYEIPWTQVPDIKQIRDILKGDSRISHIAFIHHETTTGLLNPMREIGEMAHSLGKLVIVDTISSFAGIPINFKSDHIDFLMSTSNKCIQGMAGVSFVICKKSEIEKSKDFPIRSLYLNLFKQYDYFRKHGEMQFTPPVQVLYALRQAIIEFIREGGDERHNRYYNSWKVLIAGLEDIGLDLLLDRNIQSHILTTIVEPKDPNYSFQKLHDLLNERGFTIYPGKAGKDKTFRIANMGAIDSTDMKNFVMCLKEVLELMHVRLK
jgi:2-aminoethylphosphonate aminotransferase